MSRLYEELHDIASQDATVYAHLNMQEATGASDLTTAIALIKRLAVEKKIYLDDAVDARSKSVIPVPMRRGEIVL